MRRLIFLLFLLLSVLPAGATGRSFWVEDRSRPLEDSEQELLRRMGATTLYWLVAEAHDKPGAWVWEKWPIPLRHYDGLRVVPVLRLRCESDGPFSAEMAPTLQRRFQEIVSRYGRQQVMVDCNVPERWLADYAEALQPLRKMVDALSITARIRWCEHPAFDKLAGAVDGMVPLFFDFEVDTAARLQPLVSPESLAPHIAAWKRCPVAWHAGLPWFARLSIYGPTGDLRGQAEGWTWDEVTFNQELKLKPPPAEGITMFTVQRTTFVGRTSLQPDDTLVARLPDLAALVDVENSTGRDSIFFTLPTTEGWTSWSLPQATQLGRTGMPRLVARFGSSITLVNESDFDLPPRLVARPRVERGYVLEIEAPKTMFREVIRGDFYRVEGWGDPETRGFLTRDSRPEEIMVPILKARRVQLYFSRLPARSALRTRLFRIAPGSSLQELRYRIPSVPGCEEWQAVQLE